MTFYGDMKLCASTASFVVLGVFLFLGMWRQLTKKYSPDSIPVPKATWFALVWIVTFLMTDCFIGVVGGIRDLFRR